MTADTRKSDRKRWLWFAAILICVPALMGFYSWSCLTPVYGIFPSSCDYKEPGCQAAMIDAGVSDGNLNDVDEKLNDLTEKLLVEAQASSMFSLNLWTNIEPCTQALDSDLAPYVIDFNPSTVPIDKFPDCKIDNYMGSCYCYHPFKSINTSHPFNMWLDKFVQYKHCGNSNDGRSGLIQLGPIFSWSRQVPGYLYNVPFDDSKMIQAFVRLWDDMSAVLAQAKFTLPTNEFPRRPEWIISIGNEVNLYLDNPDAVDSTGMGTPSENAWAKYKTFYHNASRYVKGLPVDIGGITHQNNSVLAWVTFSTTWFNCSLGFMLANPGVCPNEPDPPNKPGGVIDSYEDMLADSTYASYTYYPAPFGFPPETVGLDADVFRAAVFADLENMEQASIAAQSKVGRQLPIVLQEVGYPSSWVNPDAGIPPGSYNSDNIADQQEAFVQGAIEALRAHNGKWIPELAWWMDALFTPPPDPSLGPFVVPRIVSYNAFMLHDFWGGIPGTCPYERFDPFNPDAGSPTQVGVFLCSLGLRTEAGADKNAGNGKTPWGTFVDAAAPITDPGLDPHRDCP